MKIITTTIKYYYYYFLRHTINMMSAKNVTNFLVKSFTIIAVIDLNVN